MPLVSNDMIRTTVDLMRSRLDAIRKDNDQMITTDQIRQAIDQAWREGVKVPHLASDRSIYLALQFYCES